MMNLKLQHLLWLPLAFTAHGCSDTDLARASLAPGLQEGDFVVVKGDEESVSGLVREIDGRWVSIEAWLPPDTVRLVRINWDHVFSYAEVQEMASKER